MLKYSCLVVTFLYFGILIFMNINGVKYFDNQDSGLISIFLSLVVVQIGLGLIFVGLTVDPKTGKNR